MADFIFNNALGRIRTFAELAGTNDAVVVVPVEATGLEADGTLRDYDDLSTLLAGATNEQSTLGRKSITSALTVTIDDTNNRVDFDAPDQVWTGATGNGVGALLWCYDSDTTGGGDATIVPMSKHDFAFTPDGTDITAVVAAAGLMRSTG